jgi:hypothetical protein
MDPSLIVSAAYQQWLRNRGSDLTDHFHRAFTMAQGLPESLPAKQPGLARKRRVAAR